MNILGGYGSDDSGSDDEKVTEVTAVKRPSVIGPAPPPKKVVDFSKLSGCLRRPLQLDAEGQDAEEAPLAKKAKTLPAYKPRSASMLDRIPAPQMEPVSLGASKNKGQLAVPSRQTKTNFGAAGEESPAVTKPKASEEDADSSDSDDGEDVSDVNFFATSQANDAADVTTLPASQIAELPGIDSAPDEVHGAMAGASSGRMFAPGPRAEPPRAQASSQLVQEEARDQVPQDLWNHPMFKGAEGKERKRPVDGFTPSEQEMKMMQSSGFQTIHHDQMTNPDWYKDDQALKGRLGMAGEKVAFECSLYDTAKWQMTAHSNPTRTQKRKHQINWLAHDAMEKEAELLERAAQGKMNKSQTYLKYGW